MYRLIKIPARIAFYLYCRKLYINRKECLNLQGPLLIAANHPNSFLDAIIVDTLFKNTVTALTRGDVFKNKFFSRILHALHMLPIYRVSEGAENLEHNYTTFDACNSIFRKNGIVLIFSEGGCTNEWHLRSLKKGTARLAISAWNQGIPLKVLPLGINYSSFRKFGKNIWLNFGNIITADKLEEPLTSGKTFLSFNSLLCNELSKLVVELDEKDKAAIHRQFHVAIPRWKKVILTIPAAIGYIIHAPLYYMVRAIVRKNANDHYDSILIGLLFFSYPVYIGIFSSILYWFTGFAGGLLPIIVMPLSAWSLLQMKRE